jgi:hypothetical protein
MKCVMIIYLPRSDATLSFLDDQGFGRVQGAKENFMSGQERMSTTSLHPLCVEPATDELFL